MRPVSLLALDVSSWPTLLVAVGLGLLAGALVFVVGRYLMGARGPKLDDAAYNLDPRPEGSDEDLFTQGHGRASSLDRRRALRRGGNPVAVLISDGSGQAEPVHGYVVDRSTGGLCLSVTEPVPDGTVLSVRTTNAPRTVPWVQIEVRNCRPSSGEYELGCKFVRTPPWSVLLLFG